MKSTRAEKANAKKAAIIQGALTVFAEKGFDQATNRDIATAAGIASPGLIYHYFEDKQDLLAHVIEKVNPALQLVGEPSQMLELPLREALLRFGRGFMSLAADQQGRAAFRVVMAEAWRNPGTAQAVFHAGPARGIGFLAHYFEARMQRGELRQGDPVVMARQFVGPMLAGKMLHLLFDAPDPAPDLEQMVDLFLQGAKS